MMMMPVRAQVTKGAPSVAPQPEREKKASHVATKFATSSIGVLESVIRQAI
ncbi:hypothetical protein DSM25558_2202 [Agrobacterium sp. DSM 25558]|nr:hypothetical protein DSM25558_2202 [Agrobacterium sp. DSM 25558]